MNWTPSDGLRKAESTVQTLLQDMATMGVHVTNPTLRWRMVQVVGEALDGFRSGVEAVPEFPHENGRWEERYHEDGSITLTAAGPGPMPAFDNPVDAQIAAAFPGELTKKAAAEPKRRRGRPKGAKAKKAKAAPKADAVEAAAS